MLKKSKSTSVWDTEPINTILQRVHYKYMTKGLRSLSVLSEKRYEGKTTFSILLARGLSEVYNFKVLMVDLNPNGDALLNQYLKDYIDEKSQDGIIVNHPFDFSILRLKNIDVSWLKTAYDGLYANQMIQLCLDKYDFIIVDTMISDNENSMRVSTHSNVIIRTKKSLEQSKNKLEIELEQDRREVLGVVFNECDL